MKLLEKCRNFTEAAVLREMGWYPYFKVVESEQGAEAIVDGRRMIMIGSNNYLGLTNHLKVKETVINAVKRYGTGCTGSRSSWGTKRRGSSAPAIRPMWAPFQPWSGRGSLSLPIGSTMPVFSMGVVSLLAKRSNFATTTWRISNASCSAWDRTQARWWWWMVCSAWRAALPTCRKSANSARHTV